MGLGVEEANFVIWLNLGVHFFDSEGNRVSLTVKKGDPHILNKVLYRSKVSVNVIGFWQEGFKEPIWIMTNLAAEQRLSFYRQRMKIDEAFKDLKDLLRMDKMMFQKQHWMEQMISLALMAYAIGLVLGETLRSHLFPQTSRKLKLYSGVFVLLKLKLCTPSKPLFSLSELSSELQSKKLDGNHALLYHPYTCILMCRGLSK